MRSPALPERGRPTDRGPSVKKLLSIVSWGCGVAIAAMAGVFFTIFFQSHALDRDSREFADKAAVAILTGWDPQKLLDRGSAQLRAAVDNEGDMNRLFLGWRKLGPLQHYEGSIGHAIVTLTPSGNAVITATYTGTADFLRGTATIKIGLVQEDGAWRIVGFGVYPVTPDPPGPTHQVRIG